MAEGVVGMGEILFSEAGPNVLRALGLGSCIGLCVFDSAARLSCLAHIVLPEAKNKDTDDVGKYADTAVPYVVRQMIDRGASPRTMRAAIIGGAQLFSFDGADARMDIGRRNAEAVRALLTKHGLRLVAEDVGGSCGRTVTFTTSTGEVSVRMVGGVDRVLPSLAN